MSENNNNSVNNNSLIKVDNKFKLLEPTAIKLSESERATYFRSGTNIGNGKTGLMYGTIVNVGFQPDAGNVKMYDANGTHVVFQCVAQSRGSMTSEHRDGMFGLDAISQFNKGGTMLPFIFGISHDPFGVSQAQSPSFPYGMNIQRTYFPVAISDPNGRFIWGKTDIPIDEFRQFKVKNMDEAFNFAMSIAWHFYKTSELMSVIRKEVNEIVTKDDDSVINKLVGCGNVSRRLDLFCVARIKHKFSSIMPIETANTAIQYALESLCEYEFNDVWAIIWSGIFLSLIWGIETYRAAHNIKALTVMRSCCLPVIEKPTCEYKTIDNKFQPVFTKPFPDINDQVVKEMFKATASTSIMYMVRLRAFYNGPTLYRLDWNSYDDIFFTIRKYAEEGTNIDRRWNHITYAVEKKKANRVPSLYAMALASLSYKKFTNVCEFRQTVEFLWNAPGYEFGRQFASVKISDSAETIPCSLNIFCPYIGVPTDMGFYSRTSDLLINNDFEMLNGTACHCKNNRLKHVLRRGSFLSAVSPEEPKFYYSKHGRSLLWNRTAHCNLNVLFMIDPKDLTTDRILNEVRIISDFCSQSTSDCFFVFTSSYLWNLLHWKVYDVCVKLDFKGNFDVKHTKDLRLVESLIHETEYRMLYEPCPDDDDRLKHAEEESMFGTIWKNFNMNDDLRTAHERTGMYYVKGFHTEKFNYLVGEIKEIDQNQVWLAENGDIEETLIARTVDYHELYKKYNHNQIKDAVAKLDAERREDIAKRRKLYEE